MHEFPEVHAMVLQACAQIPSGARIARMTIVIGEASGHDAHHIEEHFAAASRGTAAEGARLQFVPEKLAARCAACGAEFTGSDLTLACAKCGGTELVITAGDTVHLGTVETAP